MEIRIVSAPSILGLKPSGVERLSGLLIDKYALADKLRVSYPVIHVPAFTEGYRHSRDAYTNCLNADLIHKFSMELQRVIEAGAHKGEFQLVLGGDCSILIGVMAGLKRKARFGLVFLDAHADFYLPAQSPTGEVADMDLAIVTGRGPEMLTNIGNLAPYVLEQDVIHVGQRDQNEASRYGCQPLTATGMSLYDLQSISETGISAVSQSITARMKASPCAGFWVHFDTDVIDDRENPAVDYRLPGGITWSDAAILIKSMIECGKVIGMTVTILNPNLDPTGEIIKRLGECLNSALRTSP